MCVDGNAVPNCPLLCGGECESLRDTLHHPVYVCGTREGYPVFGKVKVLYNGPDELKLDVGWEGGEDARI